MSGERITLDIDAGVARLLLNSPPKNELDWAAFERLAELVEEVLPRLDVRGLILTGRGRHFSSGSDVSELLSKAADGRQRASDERWEANAWAVRALDRLPYPVVAAISGCCLGSGLELALACHYRIGATNALLALPEAQLGLMPGCGGTVALCHLIGASSALDMIITGRFVDASEALHLGLLDHVVHRRDVIRRAHDLIFQLSNPVTS